MVRKRDHKLCQPENGCMVKILVPNSRPHRQASSCKSSCVFLGLRISLVKLVLHASKISPGPKRQRDDPEVSSELIRCGLLHTNGLRA